MIQLDDILLIRAQDARRLHAMTDDRAEVERERMPAYGGGRRQVGVIRASGVVVRESDGFEGYLDATQLAEEIEEMDEDPSVSSILLVLDTPGGMVNGTPEAASRIAAIDKPVTVWTPGLLCSAGYWLAASADMILAAPSASVGSIGAYVVTADLTAMYERMGVKLDVIASGPLKGAGAGGTPLTPGQRAFIQSRIDRIGETFADFVLTYRPMIEPEAMNGCDVMGTDAVDLGLVDGLALTEDEAIETAEALA
jgi:protease-4